MLILFVLIIIAGCSISNQLYENDPNNSEMIKEYYLKESSIQNCEHFQGKLLSRVKIESLDGVCCYYYYNGLIAPNMDGKFTLDFIEFIPDNKIYKKLKVCLMIIRYK